jgi:anti-sigma factor RsiW
MEPDHIPEDLLDEYAVGRVSGTVRRRIEEHLLVCPICLQALAIIADLMAALREVQLLNN